VVADVGEAKGPSPDMSPYARRLYIDIWQTKEIQTIPSLVSDTRQIHATAAHRRQRVQICGYGGLGSTRRMAGCGA